MGKWIFKIESFFNTMICDKSQKLNEVSFSENCANFDWDLIYL